MLKIIDNFNIDLPKKSDIDFNLDLPHKITILKKDYTMNETKETWEFILKGEK